MRIKTEDTVELRNDNCMRRSLELMKKPLLTQILLTIPLGVFNFVMEPIEYNLARSCPWCGRQYLIRHKAEECCAATKKRLGPTPHHNTVARTSCGCYGGSAEYNPYNDTYYDRSTGKTYHHDN